MNWHPYHHGQQHEDNPPDQQRCLVSVKMDVGTKVFAATFRQHFPNLGIFHFELPTPKPLDEPCSVDAIEWTPMPE